MLLKSLKLRLHGAQTDDIPWACKEFFSKGGMAEVCERHGVNYAHSNSCERSLVRYVSEFARAKRWTLGLQRAAAARYVDNYENGGNKESNTTQITASGVSHRSATPLSTNRSTNKYASV